jgi:outer membrane protein, heavy metal efflux system
MCAHAGRHRVRAAHRLTLSGILFAAFIANASSPRPASAQSPTGSVSGRPTTNSGAPVARGSSASVIRSAPGVPDAAGSRSAPTLSADAGLLHLGDVYAGVRDRNPKAAAARSLADAARARVPGASLPPDPQLQLAFMNYGVPDLRPMDPTGMPQLQVMQMVPLAGKLGLSGRIAAAQADAEGERAADVQWEVRSTAAMAFYDFYQADRSIAVAVETRRLLQDIAAVAAAMYEVGEGRQTDVLRAQVEIARMTEEITRMEAMRAAARARLNALLDREPDSAVDAASLPRFPDVLPTADSLMSMASTNRSMVRAGEQDVRAADAMAMRARRELVPDLTIGLQYGQRNGAMGTDHMASLMVGASIPVFAGRRQLKMRDEADAMRDMAQADLRYMRADTRGRVGEAYAALTQARNLERLYAATVLPQADAAVASAMAAYRVGQVDFMTLLDDRMTVNRYRQDLIALQAAEGKAWAELEMLTGTELFDANTSALTNGDAR